MKFKILGAGVAGLSAALALEKQGFRDIHIYERERILNRRSGHGLLIMQNGVRALETLGAGEILNGYAPIQRLILRDGNGRLLHNQALEKVYCVTRQGLVEGLTRQLRYSRIQYGSKLLDLHLSRETSRVDRLDFEHGQMALASDEFLIGASGSSSLLASKLNVSLIREHSPVFEIVGSSHQPDLAQQLGNVFIKTVFRGKGLAFGLLAPTPTQVVGFLQFEVQQYPEYKLLPHIEFLGQLMQTAPEPIPTYLKNLTHEEQAALHLWKPIRAELPEIGYGENCVLIGDAAHPLLPFTSQGANAAIEDSIMLANTLKQSSGSFARAAEGFWLDRRQDLDVFIRESEHLLANFLGTESEQELAPFIDGSHSALETHLQLPRGGLQELFAAIDVDSSGQLSPSEVTRLCQVLGLDSASLFAELDENGDGVVTLAEFCQALLGQIPKLPNWTPRTVARWTRELLALNVFRRLDVNGSQTLDFEEFKAGALLMGLQGSLPELERIFKELDLNGDSQLSWEEFRQHCNQDPGKFSNERVNLSVLRQRAFNYRWATLPEHVIPLTAADSDFPVCQHITQALQQYVEVGYLPYAPAEGLPEFRAAASQYLASKRELESPVERIFVTDSAASGLYLVAQHCLQPGDEALIADPVDFLFERSVLSAGGTVKRYTLQGERPTFQIEQLESLITPRTKLFGLCSPHNPLGRVWTRQELEQIGDFCLRHNLWILSDEVWAEVVYQPFKHISIASLSREIAKKTFVVSGFSKAYGLAGLRLGTLLSPTVEAHQAIVQRCGATDTAYGVSSLSQIAGTAAYQHGEGWLSDFLTHLASQRDRALNILRGRSDLECRQPEGTFVLFPRLKQAGPNFVERLKSEGGLAVVPGSPHFFGPAAAGHIRLSFATSNVILDEGLTRLCKFLDRESAKSDLILAAR